MYNFSNKYVIFIYFCCAFYDKLLELMLGKKKKKKKEMELVVAKILCLGKPAKYLRLTFKQFYPRFFSLEHSNSSKSASPYFYIGGFVAVYLSKMTATMDGSTIRWPPS